MTIKQKLQELRVMPKCDDCNCPRIKHGVYFDQTCYGCEDCYAYARPTQEETK